MTASDDRYNPEITRGAPWAVVVRLLQSNGWRALTAAAAPVLITTTNVPGSLVFTGPADAALQGVTTPIVSEDFAKPLMASAQNTALTIVAPVTTGVIWRITAGYQVKP